MGKNVQNVQNVQKCPKNGDKVREKVREKVAESRRKNTQIKIQKKVQKYFLRALSAHKNSATFCDFFARNANCG